MPPMKTVLLAAGSSRRFWPLREKFRLSIYGKTLLEHQVDTLRRAGCNDILCVISPQHQVWVQQLSLPITIVLQGEETGMCGALLAALPLCGNEPVLIVGNDFITTDAYRALQEKLFRVGDLQGILLAREVLENFPGGYLTLDRGRITAITEKPGAGREPSNLVTIIAHLHRDASLLLHAIVSTPNGGDDAYERALLSLFPHHHYAALPYYGTWFPLKYPWHALALLSSPPPTGPYIHPSVSLHPSAIVEGDVTIEEGVQVFPGATVRGPCFIGRNTIIGNNTLIWESSIGRSCVIGFGTEIKASILGNDVWTHSTYIGDSVIGENVCFGAGSITGNFRLDEGPIASLMGNERIPTGRKKLGAIIGDNCRIGIHVSMNPGVKIGEGSFISTATVVDHDIPHTSFVSMKHGEMFLRKNASPAPQPQHRLLFRKTVQGKKCSPA